VKTRICQPASIEWETTLPTLPADIKSCAKRVGNIALENELRRLEEAVPLKERLPPIQDRIQGRPLTGLKADKAFYDALNDEE
jgi:antitoxin VapB